MRVAEVGHAIVLVVLHAVLDPYLLAGQLPTDRHLGFKDDIVLLQAIHELRIASKLVVMISGDERDRYLLSRSPELIEQLCMVFNEQIELFDSLYWN